MKRYPTIVSCKCDVCGERESFSSEEELQYHFNYDPKGNMKVCEACKDEYETEFPDTKWESVDTGDLEWREDEPEPYED